MEVPGTKLTPSTILYLYLPKNDVIVYTIYILLEY